MADEATVISLDLEEPRSKHAFWQKELAASKKMLEKWHKQGTKIVQRYLGEHVTENSSIFSLNLFHSNIKTVSDMLYASLPKVEAARTHTDSGDDVARVAALTAERLMNLDIAANGKEVDSILRSVLQDRLLPGLGCARVRYEVEYEEVEIPEQTDMAGFVIEPARVEKQLVWEDAPIDYYHWQDVLWGWARSFAEVPWIAYRSYLTKTQVERRFGEEVAGDLSYRKQKMADVEDDSSFERDEDAAPWMKAEIWEIWDKVSGTVYWYSNGAGKLLDAKEDPLGLKGFFPSPPFLIANATTALYRPTPDFILSQDLYNEIDELQTRISIITEAVKVVGVYDASSEGIKRMLKEGVENDLIPVDDWAMFAEAGGLKSKIDWLPIIDVVMSLEKLRELRDDTIRLLQMTNGMADIMMGTLQSPYEGVGQSELKAQYGSVRVQALQDQFAQFTGDLMQLKLEVICKHFEPESIAVKSNMEFSPDAELVPQAVQLLQQEDMANIRVKVRPETVAMVDYARLKMERTEFLTALATFMQSAAPLMDSQPDALPYLLKMLQWTMAGFKGSNEIEGVLDRAIEGAVQKLEQEAQQPPQPDPEQIKQQGELEKIQAKSQADIQLRQADAQADMQQVMAAHQAKMAEIKATHIARSAEIRQKMMADMYKEQAALDSNLEQIEATASAEMVKDEAAAELDVASEAQKALIAMEQEEAAQSREIEKIGIASATKIGELIAQAQMKPEEKETDEDE